MGKKLIVEFIIDWIRDKALREKVLHKETTEMGSFGLDGSQIGELRKFKLAEIGKRVADELGVDLDDLRHAIYGPDSATGAVAAAAYDEGKTHIRRVVPKIVTQGTQSTVVLWGHGFKSDASKITVEFVTGPLLSRVTVPGTVTGVECGVDVWQRVSVDLKLTQVGDWMVQAHNDDDKDGQGNYIWSFPAGTIHAV